MTLSQIKDLCLVVVSLRQSLLCSFKEGLSCLGKRYFVIIPEEKSHVKFVFKLLNLLG